MQYTRFMKYSFLVKESYKETVIIVYCLQQIPPKLLSLILTSFDNVALAQSSGHELLKELIITGKTSGNLTSADSEDYITNYTCPSQTADETCLS